MARFLYFAWVSPLAFAARAAGFGSGARRSQSSTAATAAARINETSGIQAREPLGSLFELPGCMVYPPVEFGAAAQAGGARRPKEKREGESVGEAK